MKVVLRAQAVHSSGIAVRKHLVGKKMDVMLDESAAANTR